MDARFWKNIQHKGKVMLDSFEMLLTSAVIWILRVLHGEEIVLYLQNYKFRKVDQGYSKKLL